MKFRIRFAESNPMVNVEALTDLLLDVLESNSNGGLQWYGAAPERWTYTSSIYFSVTVITTIGKQKDNSITSFCCHFMYIETL